MAEPATRRRVDLLALLGGLGTLFVAAYLLGDGAQWLPQIDFRWLLAGAIGVTGVALLATSMRRD